MNDLRKSVCIRGSIFHEFESTLDFQPAQIDWDYVFFERDTENELGRQQFTSDETIGPGKTKELVVTLTSPPTRTVSVTSLNLEERNRFSEKIVLVRVQYADGRVWQLQ